MLRVVIAVIAAIVAAVTAHSIAEPGRGYEMIRRALLALALVVACSPLSAVAQDDNEAAVAVLPVAETFGERWTLLSTDFPDERLPAFRAATIATYGGPNGARIVLDALLVAEGMMAIRESWERINEYLQGYQTSMALEFDFQRDKELEAMAPPSGCADARRVEGNERIGGSTFPVGVTLCAADPDILLVAAVSGEVNGLTGVASSDAVVEMTLAAHLSTPTP
jgi:hypothetical protein